MSSTATPDQPELAKNPPEEVVQIRWLLLAGRLNEASIALIDDPLYHYLELAYKAPATEAGLDVVSQRDGAHAAFLQQLIEAPLNPDIVDACILLAHSAAHRADHAGVLATESRSDEVMAEPAPPGAGE
jgi:hypothetical protein